MSTMPVIFIGHGSPMNAIEDNFFTKTWTKIGLSLPKPKAILSISAHWYTDGTLVNNQDQPKTIYDMYGFPDELYSATYPAPGSPKLALEVEHLLEDIVKVDNSWGVDHGTWSVLHKLYPKADIPVVQLSIDSNAPAITHYEIGKKLRPLRDQGILILGSGNIVHNLQKADTSMDGGYPWAYDFDEYIYNSILSGKFEDVVDYKNAGSSSEIAFWTPEHFYPLLYTLGCIDERDKIIAYNKSCVYGSISMTSYIGVRS